MTSPEFLQAEPLNEPWKLPQADRLVPERNLLNLLALGLRERVPEQLQGCFTLGLFGGVLAVGLFLGGFLLLGIPVTLRTRFRVRVSCAARCG